MADELIEALEDLCASVEREEEVNGSISGTLMADVRIARAALTRIEPEAGVSEADLLAIREPTEAMLQPACAKHLPGRPMHDTTPPWPDERFRNEDECPHFKARRRIWKSMVDAAIQSLRSEQEGGHD